MGICSHGRQRYQCKDCGGGGICTHKRIRSQCKDCGGGSICKHKRIRSVCKDCGGGSICHHKRIRSKCKDCRKSNSPSSSSSSSSSTEPLKKIVKKTTSKKRVAAATKASAAATQPKKKRQRRSTTAATTTTTTKSTSASSTDIDIDKDVEDSSVTAIVSQKINSDTEMEDVDQDNNLIIPIIPIAPITTTTTNDDDTATNVPSNTSSTSSTKKKVVVKMKKPKKIPKVKKKKKVIPAHLPIKTHPNFTTPGIRSAVSNNQLSLHIIHTDCGTAYIRNNKRGGLKNLRCFPKCLTKGHNRNGFCGRPVKVELQISVSAFTRSQFETYEAIDIMKQTKTKEDNSRPLYKSIPTTVSSSSSSSTGGGRGVIEFNFNPTSWHYGWRRSKHMKDSAHVFRIFVFVVSPDRNLLKCIGITETSWFTLASSKRAKQDETKLKKQQQLLQKGMHSQVPPSHVSNTNHPHQSSNAHLNLLASLSKHEQNTWATNNSSTNHNNNTSNNLTRGVSFGSFSTNGMSSMMNQNHGQPLSNNGQTIHSLQGLQSLQSLHSFDGSHLNNAAYLNGMPNGTNNNKEMDIQAINQSREIQQQKAIQQLIDSGLVQSEKTKFTINQGPGAVPPANNANEKAAADAISSLSSSSSSTNYTSKEVEWVQCESCKKWRTVPSTMNVASLPDLWYCALNTWNETYNHCNKPQEKDSAIITSSQNNNIDLIRANSINTLNNLNTMNNNSANAISGLPVLGGLSYGNGLSSGLSSVNSFN